MDRTYSMPAGKKVRQGQFSDQGCQVQTSQEETVDIPWAAMRCLFVGKVEPSRAAGPSPGGGIIRGAVDAVTGGALKPDKASQSGSQKTSAYYVVDLYVVDQSSPYRLDSLSTNLRKFLGEDAGYSGEMNLVAVVKRLAEGAPHAVHASMRALLERGRNAVTTYPDLDAFRAESAQASNAQPASSGEPVPVVSRPPVSTAGWDDLPSHPEPRSSPVGFMSTPTTQALESAITSLPIPPGALPALLTGTYGLGLLFLALAAKIRFVDHPADPWDVTWWILAAACLCLAGLGTLKGRHGAMRPYFESHISLLRVWMGCAALGSLMFGVCLGCLAYSLGTTMTGWVSTTTDVEVSRTSVKAVWYMGVFVLGSAAGCLVLLGLGINLLLLAVAPEDQLLNAPTLLHVIGVD